MKILTRAVLLLIFCWVYQSLTLAATCNNAIPESTPAAAFDLSVTDGTVVHNSTGLMWSRCSLGQTWNQVSSACDDTATIHTWAQALTEANNSTLAGFTDWRLPSIKELSSIVEQKCVNPAINETVFPGAPSSLFFGPLRPPPSIRTACGSSSSMMGAITWSSSAVPTGLGWFAADCPLTLLMR